MFDFLKTFKDSIRTLVFSDKKISKEEQPLKPTLSKEALHQKTFNFLVDKEEAALIARGEGTLSQRNFFSLVTRTTAKIEAVSKRYNVDEMGAAKMLAQNILDKEYNNNIKTLIFKEITNHHSTKSFRALPVLDKQTIFSSARIKIEGKMEVMAFQHDFSKHRAAKLCIAQAHKKEQTFKQDVERLDRAYLAQGFNTFAQNKEALRERFSQFVTDSKSLTMKQVFKFVSGDTSKHEAVKFLLSKQPANLQLALA